MHRPLPIRSPDWSEEIHGLLELANQKALHSKQNRTRDRAVEKVNQAGSP